jgi:hypothetical protein
MTTIKDAPALTPTKARQGERGKPVLLVLIAALALAAIGWAGVEMWGQHIDPNKSQTAAPAPGPATGSAAQPGTVDNSPQAGQPTQLAPTDKSENNHQDVNTKQSTPAKDGVQN